MGADHTTASLFDERVSRDYEQWYEQGFGRFAAREEEALLHRQLQASPARPACSRSAVEPAILLVGLPGRRWGNCDVTIVAVARNVAGAKELNRFWRNLYRHEPLGEE